MLMHNNKEYMWIVIVVMSVVGIMCTLAGVVGVVIHHLTLVDDKGSKSFTLLLLGLVILLVLNPIAKSLSKGGK